MASDVMRVRLHLRETRVLRVQIDTPSDLRVEVASTVRQPSSHVYAKGLLQSGMC